MNEQPLQALAIQKSLTLSEDDARKVLIFMAGLDAGAKLPSDDNASEETDRVS